MSYSIVYFNKVKRFIEKLDEKTKSRIKESIEKLAFDHVPNKAVRVEGQKEKVFRIRVGDFRVLYVIHQEDKEITVFNVDKMSEFSTSF